MVVKSFVCVPFIKVFLIINSCYTVYANRRHLGIMAYNMVIIVGNYEQPTGEKIDCLGDPEDNTSNYI